MPLILAIHDQTFKMKTLSYDGGKTVAEFHVWMMKEFDAKVDSTTPDTCPLAIISEGKFLSDAKIQSELIEKNMNFDELITITPLALCKVPQMVLAHHNLSSVVFKI